MFLWNVMYRKPLNNVGVGCVTSHPPSLHSRKSAYNFWLLDNLKKRKCHKTTENTFSRQYLYTVFKSQSFVYCERHLLENCSCWDVSILSWLFEPLSCNRNRRWLPYYCNSSVCCSFLQLYYDKFNLFTFVSTADDTMCDLYVFRCIHFLKLTFDNNFVYFALLSVLRLTVKRDLAAAPSSPANHLEFSTPFSLNVQSFQV